MTLVLAKLTGPYDEVRGMRGVEVREDKVLEREGERGERGEGEGRIRVVGMLEQKFYEKSCSIYCVSSQLKFLEFQ